MCEAMAYEPEFEVACERNDRTGIYFVRCPLCTYVVTGSLEAATMSSLYTHMLHSHDGGQRVGHA